VQKEAEIYGRKMLFKAHGISLDSYVKREKIIPNFIKLDVEGAELDALRGMFYILTTYKPIITVEFWVNNLWSKRNDDILSFFEDIDYVPYFLLNGTIKKYEKK
jgi:hypothetical protein